VHQLQVVCWHCGRYQYFLQLTKDMSEGRLVAPFQTTMLLASLAVQCESYWMLLVNVSDWLATVWLQSVSCESQITRAMLTCLLQADIEENSKVLTAKENRPLVLRNDERDAAHTHLWCMFLSTFGWESECICLSYEFNVHYNKSVIV